MIKNVYIKNIKGLRGEHSLNFEVKDLKQTQIDNENSVDVIDGTKIMKAPIFIAKNASGKTTLLEAIEMCEKYGDLDNYLKDIAVKQVQEEGRELIRIAKNFKQDAIKSLIVRDKDGEYSERTDEDARDIALKLVNDLIGDISRYFIMREDVINMSKLGFLTKNDLNNVAKAISRRVRDHFSSLLIIGDRTREFVNFREEFAIRVEDTQGNVKEITNKGISLEQIIKRVVDFTEQESDDAIALPVYDTIHLISNVIGESTNVLELQGDIAYMVEHASFAGTRERVDDYSKTIAAFKPRLFRGVSGGNVRFANERIAISNSLNKVFRTMGIKFLEKMILVLDKNISHVELNGQNIIIVSKEGQKIAPEALSFGTRKVLSIIEFAFQNRSNGFIMIDEIENGLNISLINLLYRMFDELNLQIISTTHNPSIVYQGVVSPINAFVNNGDSFVSARDVLTVKRPANLLSLFRPENYKNDFHITNVTIDGFSTNSINPIELDELLDLVDEKVGTSA